MTLQQTPEIQDRPEVPYVGVTCAVTMTTIEAVTRKSAASAIQNEPANPTTTAAAA